MKKKIITDLKVVCDPPDFGYWFRQRTIEQQAKELDSWAREFNAFIRDHRSQDGVQLSIEREYADVCSHCEYDWEVDESGCPVCCQKAIDEWESEKEKS